MQWERYRGDLRFTGGLVRMQRRILQRGLLWIMSRSRENGAHNRLVQRLGLPDLQGRLFFAHLWCFSMRSQKRHLLFLFLRLDDSLLQQRLLQRR